MYEIVYNKLVNSKFSNHHEEDTLMELAKILCDKTKLIQTYYPIAINQITNENYLYKVPIKFVMSEVFQSKSKRAIRQLISPILNKCNSMPSFGIFHSSLIIGDYKYEFCDSSIIMPRKISANNALFVMDVTILELTLNEYLNLIDQLTDLIIYWNTSKFYSTNENDKSNCQDFVNDLISKLNLSEKLNHLIHRSFPSLFNERFKKGKGGMKMIFTEKFKNHFHLQKKFIKIKNHEQLDLFVLRLNEMDEKWKDSFHLEFEILKGFDQSFWLRHFANVNRKCWKPLGFDHHHNHNGEHHCKCPFGNPKESI
ncbi:hypothetical protein ABK040_007800 [Willaertia magna]